MPNVWWGSHEYISETILIALTQYDDIVVSHDDDDDVVDSDSDVHPCYHGDVAWTHPVAVAPTSHPYMLQTLL